MEPCQTMGVICLGPVCVPIAALYPLLFLLLKPLYELLKRTPFAPYLPDLDGKNTEKTRTTENSCCVSGGVAGKGKGDNPHSESNVVTVYSLEQWEEIKRVRPMLIKVRNGASQPPANNTVANQEVSKLGDPSSKASHTVNPARPPFTKHTTPWKTTLTLLRHVLEQPVSNVRPLGWGGWVRSEPLIFVDFTATWCRPCRKMAPVFEALAEEHSVRGGSAVGGGENMKSAKEKAGAAGAVFAKVDIDELPDIFAEAGGLSIPSFRVLRDGVGVDEVTGAFEGKLQDMVSKHLKKTN